jgi:hypothetical protein
MNLIAATLVHLWVAGWICAMLREALKARAVRVSNPSS